MNKLEYYNNRKAAIQRLEDKRDELLSQLEGELSFNELINLNRELSCVHNRLECEQNRQKMKKEGSKILRAQVDAAMRMYSIPKRTA